jgi:beta-glucosidase-like glycosyl hydrolase
MGVMGRLRERAVGGEPTALHIDSGHGRRERLGDGAPDGPGAGQHPRTIATESDRACVL